MLGFKQADLEKVKTVELDDLLVKFTYHGRKRTVKPFLIDRMGVQGWVVSEPHEGDPGDRWTGEEETPFKSFIAGKMVNVQVVPA